MLTTVISPLISFLGYMLKECLLIFFFLSNQTSFCFCLVYSILFRMLYKENKGKVARGGQGGRGGNNGTPVVTPKAKAG